MDRVTPDVRSRMMAAVKQRHTTPEVALRRALHRLGCRYRLHGKDLPGRPDLVLPRHRAVIFVHGCFWHAHGCRLSKLPATRPEFWAAKFETNRRRDADAVQRCLAQGWRVATVWECAIRGHGAHDATVLARQVTHWLGSDAESAEFDASAGTPDDAASGGA